MQENCTDKKCKQKHENITLILVEKDKTTREHRRVHLSEEELQKRDREEKETAERVRAFASLSSQQKDIYRTIDALIDEIGVPYVPHRGYMAMIRVAKDISNII